MAQTHIYHGPYQSIPSTASPGFLFLRDFLEIMDSLSGDPSRITKLLIPTATFIFNGIPAASTEAVIETLRSRSVKLREYRHESDVAWDIVKEDGTRTLMYESTLVVGFKGDEEGVECKIREISVVELVCEDGKWKAEEFRSVMDPSPTLPERRGKKE